MNHTLALTEALIACRTVTPAEGGALDLLEQRLAKAGFQCERLDAGPAHLRVGNLVAWHGQAGTGPSVLLLGHTDVVPTGPLEAWKSDPFVPSHREGRLYGRGAADMKAGVAAMTVAAEAFVAARPQHSGRLGLYFNSGEEGYATHGADHVVKQWQLRGEKIDACIVGEPTSVKQLGDMVKNGRRGTLSGQLKVWGIQGHVAYPQLARNPVHELAPALAELAAAVWDQGNEHFPPTTFQISNIHAGTGAGNVIPGEVTVDFNFRNGTASSAEHLMQRVDTILHRHCKEYQVEWDRGGDPFITAPGTLSAALINAIRAECGLTPELSTTGGTSDGRFVARICPQVMEFGVVNDSIHKVNEWVEVAALEPLTRVYRRTLDQLLP
jgi:succinyl-diaminopimelate desuccinylase